MTEEPALGSHWRQAIAPILVTALVAAVSALLAAGAPALARTLVVGYTTVDTENGGAESEDTLAVAAEVRARGLVVNDLEPRDEAATGGRCPSQGCDYALVAVDPAAVQSDAGCYTGAGVDCGTLDYGVVDADPEQTDVAGAARLFAGAGTLPARTVDGEALTPGVGLLCFVNTAQDDRLADDAGERPFVATQPAPIVVVYDRDPGG